MKTFNLLKSLVGVIDEFYSENPNWAEETPVVNPELIDKYRTILQEAREHQPIIKKSSIEKVAEFHKTFDHPILMEPAIPSVGRIALRINLLEEELREFANACSVGDLVEVADALCDLQYVLDGAKLEFGFKDKFDELFNEVHRSNMSKACATEQEADETIGLYTNLYGKVSRNGKWFVYRMEDMKTVKSISYSKANLRDLL